jgi:hypothetical protein
MPSLGKSHNAWLRAPFAERKRKNSTKQPVWCECFDRVFGLLKNADCAKGGLERFGVGPEGPNKDSKKVAGFPF